MALLTLHPAEKTPITETFLIAFNRSFPTMTVGIRSMATSMNRLVSSNPRSSSGIDMQNSEDPNDDPRALIGRHWTRKLTKKVMNQHPQRTVVPMMRFFCSLLTEKIVQ